MMTDKVYGIFYWSAYRNRWVEYLPITHNARPYRVTERSNAEGIANRVRKAHPNDQIKVMEV